MKKTANELAKQGFTLIEILVVVAIIGLLGAVAVPAYMKNLEESRVTTAQALIKNIEDACQMYKMKHSGYPKDLSALTEPQGDEEPYLDGEAVDPWGRDINYENKGKKIHIWSLGPDEADDGDDIMNRTRERDLGLGKKGRK